MATSSKPLFLCDYKHYKRDNPIHNVYDPFVIFFYIAVNMNENILNKYSHMQKICSNCFGWKQNSMALQSVLSFNLQVKIVKTSMEK